MQNEAEKGLAFFTSQSPDVKQRRSEGSSPDVHVLLRAAFFRTLPDNRSKSIKWLQNEAEDELTFSTSKFLDVKQTRQLVTEITQRGAALYDALDKEPGLRVS
jgi:hypothetical protein